MFKKFLALVLCFVIVFGVFSISASASEIAPSTWTAVDGLGRTLSENSATSGEKQEKFVGMFYWIWHYPWTADTTPITTGSVLDKYPEALNDFDHPAWGGTYSGRPYFWDEPIYGFYSNLDEYVLRKHAELLADADIDVVIFDSTNSILTFSEGYEKLFKVWSEAKEDGVDVPQVAFILNFSGREDTRTQLRQLYNDVYSKGRYEDLWFKWEGKPLVMAKQRCLNIFDKTDREALIAGILDGTVDMIATDHAPHSAEEKSKGLEKSAMGITGIETAFSILYTKLVKTGVVTLEKLVELLNTNARKRFGIGSEIAVGESADLTVFDLDKEYEINPEEFISKGKATPFKGEKVFAKCRLTMCEGNIVWQDNE